MLGRTGAVLGAAGWTSTFRTASAAETGSQTAELFGYCFNTATILGQKLPLDREVEITAKAGYQAVEPWVRNIQRHVDEGGSLADMKKRIADLGLSVAGAIGFATWAVEDDAERAKGLEQLRRDMELVAGIGGARIAAPPAGINKTPGVDLRKVAERYRAALELGRRTGVVPQLEFWGSSLTLSRLGEATFVAIEAGHPDACLLLDAYHLYKGGNDFAGLNQIHGGAMHVFHLNDYPAEPPRQTIDDSFRVYPGDGICPLGDVLGTLHRTGFRGMLSLELFNRRHWEQDPLEVARTGLAKMKSTVAAAGLG
ncbi:MAG: sugar phosphate isomerase/epimerase [Pirellulales bacterium]|nr:sugar phosphate isomerase/epimerase [Pirellulales bacterium]